MAGVLVVAVSCQAAFAQQAPSGLIQGMIVQAGAADMKVPGATVEIRRDGGAAAIASAPLFTTTTDADGKYYFPNLAPGQYRLTASAPGYVRTEYGQKKTYGAG